MGDSLKSKTPHVIKYMGSKRNILSHVIKAIMKVHDPKKPFLDLMTGTGSIGYAIKTYNGENIRVIANDVQLYSFVIAKTLIANTEVSAVSKEKAEKDLLENFQKNMDLLEKKYDEKFIRTNQYRTGRNEHIRTMIQGKEPYALFTFYYTDIFFSVRQSKQIDSIRYAISKIENQPLREFYLTCLLYAVSYGSWSFGHFAQPRAKRGRPISDEKSIWELFIKKVESLHITSNSQNNLCFNVDYAMLLTDAQYKSVLKGVGTVYLDPPYSSANYSRFYHLLETLIRYDYPTSQYKGLYRDDRFFSKFCRKTEVTEAFREVIKFSHDLGANLVISYSNTGLLTKRKIKALCKEHYPRDQVWDERDVHHIHSTQGNRKKNGVMEHLIICKY